MVFADNPDAVDEPVLHVIPSRVGFAEFELALAERLLLFACFEFGVAGS